MQLVTYPDSLLLSPSKPVDLASLDVSFINKLLEKAKNMDAFGLAAVQVGNPIRLFVAKFDDKKDYEVVINPHVIRRGEETNKQNEGCFSFPGLMVPVDRPTRVHVVYQLFESATQDTREVERAFAGIQARIMQHELEHLEGKTFLDHMGDVRKDMYKRKYGKVKRRLDKIGRSKM